MRKRKKIAILTINGKSNYGNRLQNYAVQEILKKYNFDIETICNIQEIYGIKYIKTIIKDSIKKILVTKKGFYRYALFMNFDKYVKYSKYHIDKNHIPKKLGEKYDYFFTGSDQVWNPTFGRMSDIDFLTFAEPQKRNSISASIGIDDIPDDFKDYYKEKLMQMNSISVREDKAKEIIENLTGRKDVQVLIDPTMMLTTEEWNKVSKKPKQLTSKKYILNYFLGELSEKRKKEINRIANENNCEVINILDKDSPFYETGPSEFLYLEKNAFLICTDSFHSCVFSIIYQRPFVVFDREDKEVSMNSRIDTLLNKFNLQKNKFNGVIAEEQLKCDYSLTNEILDKEKEKMNKFVKRVLEIEE